MTTPLAVNFTGKVYGANLVPRYGDGVVGGAGSWPVHWTDWNTTWPDWRKQIDHAYAAGCNAVRVLGAVGPVVASTITQSQYNARWVQLVEYANSLGLYVYVANETARTGQTDAQLYDTIGPVVQALAGYNILGIDIVQECTGGQWGAGTKAQNAAHCAAVYAVIKPLTAFPCTFSTFEVMSGTTIYDGSNNIMASVDYLDYHVYKLAGYSDYPGSSTLDTPLANHSTYDILLGEFGDPISSGSSHNTSWINGCIAMVNRNTAHVRGGLFWAITDQDSVDTNQWGFTSSEVFSAYVPRDWIVNPLVNATASAAGPAAPPAPVIPHDSLVLVNPKSTTTDFVGVKIYRDENLIASTLLGYYLDNDNLITGQTYSYTAKISTGTHGDSSASAATSYSPVRGNAGGGSGGIPVFSG